MQLDFPEYSMQSVNHALSLYYHFIHKSCFNFFLTSLTSLFNTLRSIMIKMMKNISDMKHS